MTKKEILRRLRKHAETCEHGDRCGEGNVCGAGGALRTMLAMAEQQERYDAAQT